MIGVLAAVFVWRPVLTASDVSTGATHKIRRKRMCAAIRRNGAIHEKSARWRNAISARIWPHCSSGCPFGTIYFGDENEDAVTNSRGETLRFSKLLRDRAGYRHLEYLGTAPRCYYLPPINRQFPAPDQAKKKA